MNSRLFFVSIISLLSLSSFAQISGLKKVFTPSRDLFLGKVIKSGLESYHFSKKKVNDDLSKDAFKIYVERLDYSKRYLLNSDVQSLQKYEEEIDDQMTSGKLELMRKAEDLLKKRIGEIKVYTKDILKKPFDFSKKETLELDPKKREFVESKEEQKDLWRKILKVEALNRYLGFMDQQEALKKEKKKDKKEKKKDKKTAKKEKKEKEDKDSFKVTLKTTQKQMEAEARKSVAKSFKRIFKRKLQTDHNDELSRMFNAVSMAFDPHTNYYAPKAKEDFDIDISGSLEGIGAVLREDGDYIKVVEIVPGSASWKQGDLKPEFTILKVANKNKEPVDIVGMRLEDAVRLIRGPKGTTVTLTVKQTDGTIKEIPIVRDTVVIEESYAKSAIIEEKGTNVRLGYIFLPKFYRDFSKGYFDSSAKNCTEDVKEALVELKKYNVDGIILDLRMNGGGSLEDAVQMSGLFIKEGPIVQVKSSQGKISVMRDSNSSVTYDGPLIVMVNKFSASASEILAGAMQDYNRALIVGASGTHGKGTVQSIIDLDQAVNASLGLPSLGSIKLTISKFYRVTGSSTQFKGITPDIILPDHQDYIDTGEKELDHALPWDEIKAVPYKKWRGDKGNLSQLIKKSGKRVDKNEDFQKLQTLTRILKARREETMVNLNAMERRKKDKEYEKQTSELRETEEAKWYSITPIADNYTKGKLKEDKRYKENVDTKNKNFVTKLTKDIQLGETLHIFKDLFKASGVNIAAKAAVSKTAK